MPRTLSDAIKTVLANPWGETHDAVIITFPASGDADEIVLHLCSYTTGLTIDGQDYVDGLRSVSQIKFSIGVNADQATITLENVSKTIGLTITDTSRTLDGSRIEIRRAYKIADGTFESISLFHGVVQGVSVDENVATLTVVSDFTQRKAQVASRQCTQRCIWTFKGTECGWTVPQGGDPDNCDLIFDSPGGCSGHNNQFRFGGVPPLISGESTTPVTGITGGPIGSSGSGGGGTGSGGYDDYPLLRKIYDPDIGIGGLLDDKQLT
jgi:hypothetical protein